MFSKGSKTPPAAAKPDVSRPSAAEVSTAAPSIISADLKIVGNLLSGGDLQIDGTVEGDISTRRITVGEGAIVQGAITAETVRVYGTVAGEIKASNVHLAKSARVDGDIGHQSIAMEAGASVNGRLTRLDKSPAVQRPSGAGKAQETTSGNGSSSATPPAGGGSSTYGSGYRA
jgi:cytoskeletal protein CcmA (bactofilin family)